MTLPDKSARTKTRDFEALVKSVGPSPLRATEIITARVYGFWLWTCIFIVRRILFSFKTTNVRAHTTRTPIPRACHYTRISLSRRCKKKKKKKRLFAI